MRIFGKPLKRKRPSKKEMAILLTCDQDLSNDAAERWPSDDGSTLTSVAYHHYSSRWRDHFLQSSVPIPSFRRWLTRLQRTDAPTVRYDVKSAKTAEETAIIHALDWLRDQVRNSSHENLVFIRGKGDEARIVVHGNSAFRYA